ncbi:MAG: hypothetical protein PVI07_10385 [Anaerolineae bacterium]|jgi:hypothetical protein
MNVTAAALRAGSRAALLGVLLLGLLAPIQASRADIGPKPSMTFEFIYRTESPLIIVQGQQLQCQESTCADAKPLHDLGPQHFACTELTCTSMAYGYSPYNKLRIRFSDGVTRDSQVFETGSLRSTYQVNVRDEDLLVEKTAGRATPDLLPLIVRAIALAVLGPPVLAAAIWLIVKAQRGRIDYVDARGPFIGAWAVSVPALAVSAMFTASAAATLILEGLILLGYALWREQPLLTWLTHGLLVNVITQPVLWLTLGSQLDPGPYLAVLAMSELAVWLLEALLLCLLQGKRLPFRNALALSLVLNGVSFAAGLLLPV